MATLPAFSWHVPQ